VSSFGGREGRSAAGLVRDVLSLSEAGGTGLTSRCQPECGDPRVWEEPPVNAPNDSLRGAVRLRMSGPCGTRIRGLRLLMCEQLIVAP